MARRTRSCKHKTLQGLLGHILILPSHDSAIPEAPPDPKGKLEWLTDPTAMFHLKIKNHSQWFVLGPRSPLVVWMSAQIPEFRHQMPVNNWAMIPYAIDHVDQQAFLQFKKTQWDIDVQLLWLRMISVTKEQLAVRRIHLQHRT